MSWSILEGLGFVQTAATKRWPLKAEQNTYRWVKLPKISFLGHLKVAGMYVLRKSRFLLFTASIRSLPGPTLVPGWCLITFWQYLKHILRPPFGCCHTRTRGETSRRRVPRENLYIWVVPILCIILEFWQPSWVCNTRGKSIRIAIEDFCHNPTKLNQELG